LELQAENLTLHKQILGENGPATWASMKFLADRYTALKRPAEAIPHREELLALQRAKLGDDHKDTVSSMIQLADDYVACGRYEDALPWRERIVAIRKASPQATEPKSLISMRKLAWTYGQLGRDTEAVQLYGDLLSMNHGQLDPKELALCLNNLAWHLSVCPDSSLRDPPRACRLAAQAVELQPQKATYWNTLGAAQYRAGVFEEAAKSLNRSVELQVEGSTWDWILLAMTHWQLGNADQARCYYQMAQVDIDKALADDRLLRFARDEAQELLQPAIEAEP
jgi:tetratricopeptide (TPR) repeat protein